MADETSGRLGEKLEGVVRRVVYRAAEGPFAVIRLDVKGRSVPVAVVGNIGDAQAGETLAIEGEWERHPEHGDQFRATRAVIDLPKSAEGVGKYLESLPGFGPALAERLVAAFGVEAIEIVEKEPWRIAQVKGVGKSRAARAQTDALSRKAEREIMVFLQGLGISPAYAARIRKRYGESAAHKVRENPYRLARDVSGIGFLSADRIAQGMGIARDSPLRVQAGVLHDLERLSEEGHLFGARGETISRTAVSLEVQTELVEEALKALVLEGALVIDKEVEDEALYLPRLHRAEVDCARRIAKLLSAHRPIRLSVVGAEKLTVTQRGAIEKSAEAAVTVLTGGPGTGKTTVVRALVASWQRAKKRVLCAAPTGRAARRLSEASGHPAQTIHRLLEWGQGADAEDRFGFSRKESNPLEVDLLVVDEASMLDIQLARALFLAVPQGASVVLVGDVDQLPPVGPGQVLSDIIASKVVPVTRLSEVFRQAQGSGIIDNAYRVLHGEFPQSPREGEGLGDFFFIPADTPEKVRDVVLRLLSQRIPQAFHIPWQETQVLTPMHRGPAGTEELNRVLQATVNPRGRELVYAGRTFRAGDRLMQIRNNYDRDVYNGDVGYAARVVDDGPEAGVWVEFDGRVVHYQLESLGELEHAFAMTVHKSQGSEYAAVVVPMLMHHRMLLRRNLLYTAVTRGKKLVVLVGQERAIRFALDSADAGRRATRLESRLRQFVVG